MAGLALFSGAARADTYVEAYLGGVAGSATAPFSGNWTGAGESGPFGFRPSGSLSPAVVGGLKIGTWFAREGFPRIDYPDWMKYFGFYLDFGYHRLDFERGEGMWNYPTSPGSYLDDFRSTGNAATLSFMFAARYGLLPDPDVPFGRLQPYIAAGPAVLFSSQKVSFFNAPGAPAWSLKTSSQSSTDLALATEVGLRWMVLKNVSLDVSFQYQHANPSYHYPGIISSAGDTYDLTFSPTYDLFIPRVGVAYHF